MASEFAFRDNRFFSKNHFVAHSVGEKWGMIYSLWKTGLANLVQITVDAAYTFPQYC